MNTDNLIYGVIGLLSGIIIGIFIAPTVAPQSGYMGMMWRGGNSQTMSGEVDEHFIEQMIPHHEGAIAMAELALERSARPEIRSLAEDIVDAQTKEIIQMKSWHREWFGSDVSEYNSVGMGMMMGGGHMVAFEGDLDELVEAEDFDLEFIRQMIPHHEMAIMMASMLKASSERKEMQELAGQIITSQSREIDMMRSWYADWSNR